MKKVLVFLCLFSTQVFAQDGVLEINQLCVAAGCFEGDDPGFPVEIINAGSYRLTSNIIVTSAFTTAIEATGPQNLTIDLNGFGMFGITDCSGGVVTCTNTGTGDGITLIGTARVVIKNGSIIGFGDHGITGNVFSGFTIREVLLTDNGDHAINALSGASVIDCEISTNGGNGFNASTSSTSSLIRGNRFINNGGTGVNVGSCGNNIFALNDNGQENCSSELSPNLCSNTVCSI